MRFVGYAKMYCERCALVTTFRVYVESKSNPRPVAVLCARSLLERERQLTYPYDCGQYIPETTDTSVTPFAAECGWAIRDHTRTAIAFARARYSLRDAILGVQCDS